MISDSKKIAVIEKITQSKEFKFSQTYSNLLQYLFEHHLKDEIPKETAIAIEFFDQKSTFNPTEVSTIRSNMYKLRKKLEHYYNTEGKEDDVVVRIPKGHYEMQFYDADKEQNALAIGRNKKKENILILLSSLLTLLVVLLIVYWQHLPRVHEPISNSDPIWKSFFSTDYPITIVIGDIFVFEEDDDYTKRFRRIMDYSIKTKEDFLKYQSSYPERVTRLFDLKELPHNSIFNIRDIMHVFYSFNKTFDIKFSYSFDSNDFTNHNTIYIGEFGNLRLFNDLMEIIPSHFEHIVGKERRLIVFTEKMDTLETFQTKRLYSPDGKNLDYGLFAKLPGLNGETHLIIAGFGYMAQVELVKILSSRKSIEMLENQITKQYTPDFHDYFYAIFKVSGYKTTAYTIDLIFYKEIDTNRFKASFKKLLSNVTPQSQK